MEESGIDISHIEKENIATGIAVINVDKKGNNNIVVIAGANNQVDKPYLQRLLDKGVKKIIVTWGSKGVIYMDQEGDRHFEAKKVQVIDTTAAGDSFIGGFTVSFLEDQNIEKAIDMGQSTAALAIQKMGAQSSIPTRAEVENFMSQKN